MSEFYLTNVWPGDVYSDTPEQGYICKDSNKKFVEPWATSPYWATIKDDYDDGCDEYAYHTSWCGGFDNAVFKSM